MLRQLLLSHDNGKSLVINHLGLQYALSVQLCSEVVVRRRSELDERISKSDIGITMF